MVALYISRATKERSLAANFHAQIFSLLPEVHTEAEKQQVLFPCGCVAGNNLVMSSQQVTDVTIRD